MFGIWRTLLAIEVVVYHLAGVRVIGQYAVFSFFVLSGFLMTTILHGTYGYSRKGFVRYLQNRALRLYPSYWFALLVSVALIAIIGAAPMQAYNSHIVLPTDAAEWLQNLTIIFFDWAPFDHAIRLVPPTWALTVEISYYVLIGLGLSRTRQTTILWVVASAVYPVYAYFQLGGGGALYGTILAGSLPFSIGALTWHYREDLARLLRALAFDRPVALIVLRWLSWAAFAGTHLVTGKGWLISLGNYVNIAISALIVCALFHHRGTPRARRLDKAVGDFSYPIYLLHWQGTAIASMIVFGTLVFGPTPRGLTAAALGLAVTLALALVCVRVIDPAIERRRTNIRKAA